MKAPATYYHPVYGPSQIMVTGKGKKPGTLIIGSERDAQEVPASSVKFKFGPDSEKFGIPYKDPYASTNESRNMKITVSQLRRIIKEEVSGIMSEMPRRGTADFYSIATDVEQLVRDIGDMTLDLGQTRVRLEVKAKCQQIIDLLDQLK